jgi:sugar phosphate isomerase/epimerase
MLDFPTVFAALHKIGYDGSMALECRLRGDPSTALHETTRYLRTARTSS